MSHFASLTGHGGPPRLGRVFPHPVGCGATFYAAPVTMERAKRKPFSLASQTLAEPAARVRDLDEAGVASMVRSSIWCRSSMQARW